VKLAVIAEEKVVSAQTAEAQAIRDDTQRDLDKVSRVFRIRLLWLPRH
jgi:hypothetical protein